MQHIIKKQIIDLTLNQKMDAFAIQHLVSERYWEEIVPNLQKVFDGISTEEEILHLDKLEIDLGTVNARDIEKGRWKDEVYKSITEQLSALVAGASENQVSKQSVTLSIAEQWIFYMEHGYLPWNILQTSEEWYKNVLEAFAGNSFAIDKLRSLINTNSIGITRIVSQHSREFLKALMETLTAGKQEKLPKLLDEMSQVILFLNQLEESDQFAKRKWVQKLWLQAFRFSVSGNEKFNSEKLIVHLLNENIQGSELLKDLPGKFLSANRLTASILKQIKNGKVKLEKNAQSKEAPLMTETLFKNESNLEEGIYVLHAGVVLLHPFLNIFFKGLGLVKENVFVNESAHQKALFLLHYMATGLRTANEHELVIEKILCAWPLEKPVGLSVPIKAGDLKEADNLLTEVIQQWKILKKTSFAGLREGFLQRGGKLYTRNDSLRLQVEATAIDVLLDELPWNLALIKLPWMNDILRVEWR